MRGLTTSMLASLVFLLAAGGTSQARACMAALAPQAKADQSQLIAVGKLSNKKVVGDYATADLAVTDVLKGDTATKQVLLKMRATLSTSKDWTFTGNEDGLWFLREVKVGGKTMYEAFHPMCFENFAKLDPKVRAAQIESWKVRLRATPKAPARLELRRNSAVSPVPQNAPTGSSKDQAASRGHAPKEYRCKYVKPQVAEKTPTPPAPCSADATLVALNKMTLKLQGKARMNGDRAPGEPIICRKVELKPLSKSSDAPNATQAETLKKAKAKAEARAMDEDEDEAYDF